MKEDILKEIKKAQKEGKEVRERISELIRKWVTEKEERIDKFYDSNCVIGLACCHTLAVCFGNAFAYNGNKETQLLEMLEIVFDIAKEHSLDIFRQSVLDKMNGGKNE